MPIEYAFTGVETGDEEVEAYSLRVFVDRVGIFSGCCGYAVCVGCWTMFILAALQSGRARSRLARGRNPRA